MTAETNTLIERVAAAIRNAPRHRVAERSQNLSSGLITSEVIRYEVCSQLQAEAALAASHTAEALVILQRLMECEHTRGGALHEDGQFHYRVPESVFKRAATLLAKIESGAA